MSKEGEFVRELDKLYHSRTLWLRAVLDSDKPGAPHTFSRNTVDQGIARLQAIASDALAAKLAKEEFSKFALSKRIWRVKGHGPDKKRQLFIEWYKNTLGTHDDCIYVFWGNKGKCIYVGRTGSGGSRPQNHFEKYWFGATTRIDVYLVNQPSQLPKLECLAIHRFLPTRNKSKAATQKWTKKCPLCRIHRDINTELRRIFRFK